MNTTKIANDVKLAVDSELSKYNLGLGSQIYAIRTGCFDCSEYSDHCAIYCEKKNKRYWEPIQVEEITVAIEAISPELALVAANDIHRIHLKNEEQDMDYSFERYGTGFYRNREDAVMSCEHPESPKTISDLNKKTIELDVVNAMKKVLSKSDLMLGETIYVIRTGCFECPDEDDHCAIGCLKKKVRYFEPVPITSITTYITATKTVITLENVDKAMYCDLRDYKKTFFLSRDDAVMSLVRYMNSEFGLESIRG